MEKVKFIDGERYLLCASHLEYMHENDFSVQKASPTGRQYRCKICEKYNKLSQTEDGLKRQGKANKETLEFLEKLGYDIHSGISIHEQFKQRHYNEHN